jgi:hypothetical protein
MSVEQQRLAGVIAVRFLNPKDLATLCVKPASAHQFVDRASGQKCWIKLEHGLRPERALIKLAFDLLQDASVRNLDEAAGIARVVTNQPIAQLKNVHDLTPPLDSPALRHSSTCRPLP